MADGETSAVSEAQLGAHLSGCRDCTAWQRASEDLTRRARVGGPLPDADLADRVVAAVAADVVRRRSRRQWLVAAGLVVLCGALQLLVSVPLLVLSHHDGHRSTSDWLVALELAVGASFFVGALVLLWHTKGEPVEPAVPLTAVDEPHGSRREGNVA